MLTGGKARPTEQQSQSLSIDNTVFNYQPNNSSVSPSFAGGFVGAEYSCNEQWAWQFGVAFYQIESSPISGEETQAPSTSIDAVNIWNYQYKTSSRQVLIENKLLLLSQVDYFPYFMIGVGGSFNRAYNFQATPQNSGEVATAIFEDHTSKTFTYTLGFGLDLDIFDHVRLGAGYRFAYLGKFDLGKGTINTGTGGNVFPLPALESKSVYNNEIVVQLMYLV